MKLGQLHDALTCFLEASHLRPKDVRLLTSIGVIYENMDRSKEAIETFKKVLKMDDNNLIAKYYLANLYLYEDIADTAIELYDQILEADPEFSEAKTNLALCYLKQKDYDTALKLYDEILAKDKENQVAVENRNFILSIQKGEFE